MSEEERPQQWRTDEEMKKLVREISDEVVDEAVKKTLVSLGLNIDDPIEMQKDFQHLREWRTLTDAIERKGMMTVAAIVVSGAAAMLWVGFKAALNGGSPTP